MKQKSSSRNPFRYVSFTEQIANMNADVVRWKSVLPTTTDESETFFHDAIMKYNEMDYGGFYRAFLDDIPFAQGELRTYAQLLHHQKTVFAALLKHLSIKESSSLPTILELTIAFARDLREDLSPYLWDLFEVIVALLESANQHAELLQAGFRALAVFFKLQWRKIVKELRRTFLRFERLFASKRNYVRRFAAEAFAFLLRKSNAIGKLTVFLAESAEKDGQGSLVDGISQLYFNTLKGVMKQYHSTAPQILTELLQASLSIEHLSTRETAIRILEGLMSLCASYTKKEHNRVVFDSVLQMFTNPSKSLATRFDAAALSRLLLVWVITKNGASIPQPVAVLTALRDNVHIDGWRPESNFLKLLSSVISSFHSEPNVHSVIIGTVEKIAKKAESSDADIMFDLFWDLSNVPMFDLFLMPTFGEFSSKMLSLDDTTLTSKVFEFYALLCAKRRPSIKRAADRISFFDVSNHTDVRIKLLDILRTDPEESNFNVLLVSCAVCIYPWIWRQAEQPEEVELLGKILRWSLQMKHPTSSYLALLAANAISLVDRKIFASFSVEDFLTFLRLDSCSENSLRVMKLAVLFTADFKTRSQKEIFLELSKELIGCFGSWKCSIRQLALELLNLFKLPVVGVDKGGEETEKVESMFDILLLAERTSLTLEDYRTRLMYLRRLKYGAHKKHLPQVADSIFETVPLRIVIAQLYERFTIIWPHLFDIVESYAYGMDIDVFWPLFSSFIEYANSQITCQNNSGRLNEDLNKSLLGKLVGAASPVSPDYGMFRLQMLKMLSRIADIAERRTKVLSPMLIKLFREEYESFDFLARRKQDITWKDSEEFSEFRQTLADEVEDKQNSEDNTRNSEEGQMESDVDVDTSTEDVEEERRKKTRYAEIPRRKRRREPTEKQIGVGKKMVKRTIVALLETFASFKGPRAVYMEKEIRSLYDELLMLPDEEVQRAAMKCLFSYNYKFLSPYRESFENLVNDRTFLDELVRFGIDSQDSAVAEEHRDSVIPLLMRLLYGKMQAHVSSAGKRVAVFRFLAGCKPKELNVFIAILLAPLIEVLGNDITQTLDEACAHLCSTFDPTSMIPLANIKRSLSSLSHIVTRLSPSLENDQQAGLFRLYITAAVIIRLASEADAKIHPKNVKVLKGLRTQACAGLAKFFHSFRQRTFSAVEIEALFKYYVAPICDKSVVDLVTAPLSLIRLFASWTEEPMLFYMLQVRIPLSRHDGEHTPLAVMTNTLLSRAANCLTKECIVDAILNLVRFADEENPNIAADLALVEIRRVRDVNVGTSLVLKELPKLLNFIMSSLPQVDEKKKINLKHLDVLSRLSEFVDDAVMGERFAHTLLAYTEASVIKNDETLQALLLTVSRIIPIVQNPASFFPKIVRLQSIIKSRENRAAVSAVTDALKSCMPLKGTIASELLGYVSDLNSWDPRRFEEPDYDRRHTAYIKLSHVWDMNANIDASLVQMIAHNHYYTITEVSDISLRSAASTNLRRLIEFAGTCKMDESVKEETLEKHLLPLVIKGLHSETEATRHDFISALVSLVISFPTHKQLLHLEKLRNMDDIDLDFFENVAHIQLHRRQRAFRRLTDNLESGQIMLPVEVMHRFLFPILQPYIMEVTSKTSAVSDEAIRLLSYILKFSPWKRYWPMLDFHLRRLQRGTASRKAAIRVIVAIVDAFHFDISLEEDNSEDWKAAKKWKPLKENGEDYMETGYKREEVIALNATEEEESSTERTTEDGAKMTLRQKVIGHLLPRLKACATGKDLHMYRRTEAGKHYDEDDDIQRAPVALATVKLLQKLPQTIMDEHLQSVVLKLCSLLMSRSINVRDSARKTIIAVVKSLGPKYLPYVVREMKNSLNKGYQVHVMIYTVHALIFGMQDCLRPQDLDPCLYEIIDVCQMDLFGDTAEEKEVTGITKNVPEAKANRTFDTFALLGRFIGPQSLGLIISPLKEILESSPTAKTINHVCQLLRHFANGLNMNEGVDSQYLLIFAYQLLRDHVNVVISGTKPKDDSKNQEEQIAQREQSCLLLEREPKRLGVIVKTSPKSRMFVFIEFGLQILASCLKQKKLDPDVSEDSAKLDPFVSLVAQCLQLKYDKVVSNGLRCFISLLKFPLPSLHSQMQTFVDRLFMLLSDYAAMGTAGNKGTVLELSHLLFKAFTQLIKDAPTLVLSSKGLQLLLNYVETDVIDSQKQATAFSLIKAIVGRKLQDPKILDVINYLSELAITSEISHIRAQCRQVLLQFIGSHPMSKKPKKYIEFFLCQLEYEHEDGRISAIEMLNLLFDSFTEKVNDQYCLLAIIKMATRLANDDSEKCRRLVALAIRKLLASVSEAKLNDVYLAVRDWMRKPKETFRNIAMQLLVELCEVKEEMVSNHLDEILPVVSEFFSEITLSCYAEISVITVLNSFCSICRRCQDAIKENAEKGHMDSVFKGMGRFMKCADSPSAQLSASRLLGQLFSMLNANFFALRTDPSPRDMAEWIFWQLKSRQLKEDVAEQAARNLIFLSRLLHAEMDLKWLYGQLVKICKFEIARLPGEALRRLTVFKMVAALTVQADAAHMPMIVDSFLPSIHRELKGKSSQNKEMLQQTAVEVSDIIKEKFGEDKFAERLLYSQKAAANRFEMRKRKQKEEAVTDPAGAALKKQRRSRAKIAAKKRKLDAEKPYRVAVRRKKEKAEL